MISGNEEDGGAPAERLNYFNYFTEVEEEFARRRGKSLLISPMDWALVESWRNAGIPLHIVLRAINRAFDQYEARARKYRKINTVFYCQQEVEATFAEYQLAQVGAKPEAGGTQSPDGAQAKTASAKRESASPFPKEVLMDFLSRCAGELQTAAALAADAGTAGVAEVIRRAHARLADIAREVEAAAIADAEAIEHDLDGIDRMILESLRATLGEAGLQELRAEAESQLHPYRKKMEKAIYEKTIENFIAHRLRDMYQIPRLSLFYI
ncbi:MAG TPA: hypothetical protein VNO70_02580 [Blastocatellia bacterium]|nr:hypothetical protein [Blastocatellia bacterium]